MSETSTHTAQPYTILIVDDRPASMSTAVAYLEDYGFDIVVAQDGEEALRRAEFVQPDLILLDVVMQGMDGFETCRRLKASESTREIPVIFMTALTETADKILGFEAGGADYVTKPFELDEVVARIKTHLAMYKMRRELAARNAQLQQEIATRERFEGALRLAHNELEQRVVERTAELTRANTVLKGEIAERKRVEAALRESQDLLRAIIDNSMTVIYVKDVQGRFLLANRRFRELFHVSDESIVGKTDHDIFPREVADAFRAMDRQVLETQKPLGGEEIAPHDDGLHTYISIKCPLYDATGTPYAVCSISTDITERKRAEEEREALLASEQAARSKAETADRLKDEFLAILSHELRTPLTAIIGWTQLLRQGELDVSQVQRGIEVIERNSWAELRIVEDLLNVSAIILGKVVLEAQPVRLAPVIYAALDCLKLAAEVKSINVSVSLNAPTCEVFGDRNRLQQVIWNLLSNAVKFTPPGGRVFMSLEEAGSRAQIRISDTGEGIDPEFLPCIFERFRQSDSSPKRRRGGLGLGLSIVQSLVELHGGVVRGESGGVGKGATFTVELPLMVASHKVASQPSGSEGDARVVSPALTGLRVLVVEDEPDLQELMACILAGAGAEVRVATLAQEGFEILKHWRPDVLVSDIGLPGEDGYALIQRIRALPIDRGGQTPAAALTGYADQSTREKTLSAGYQVYIPKPVETATLMDAIAGLVSRDRHHLVC